VVYVASNNATSFTSGYFWQHVNQSTIDTMVDEGVMNLTGAGTVADAWRAIITGYMSGQKVAIKVSFNNSTSCSYESNNIDAVVEPVLAVIRGLRAINVPESDIYVYECFRYIPTRFVTPLLNDYPDVKIYDGGFCSNLEAKASNQNFTFATPPNKPGIVPHPIPQVLLDAHHLINIPIMKFHSMPGYSLGMKNHYGSTTKKPGALHDYSSLASPNYTSTYSPIVDLNLNPNIRDKTRLILADGLFSAFRNGSPPSVWQSFGNKYPNSLMFAFDPVAIDCVMADYLDHEHDLSNKGIEDPRKNDYLVYAEQIGLGILERGDPWTNNYTKILLNKIEV
jgi:hypothetical protein